MWYKHLYKGEYLYKLYKDIVPLNNVRISGIGIEADESRLKIIFDMPNYADFPPHKWEKGCNVAIAEIDFTGVTSLQVEYAGDVCRGDISIDKNAEGLLEISIKGDLSLHAIADFGMIQRLSAYRALQADES